MENKRARSWDEEKVLKNLNEVLQIFKKYMDDADKALLEFQKEYDSRKPIEENYLYCLLKEYKDVKTNRYEYLKNLYDIIDKHGMY